MFPTETDFPTVFEVREIYQSFLNAFDQAPQILQPAHAELKRDEILDVSRAGRSPRILASFARILPNLLLELFQASRETHHSGYLLPHPRKQVARLGERKEPFLHEAAII